MSDADQHGMNCPSRESLNDDSCTCALRERMALQTEQTMHAAWRKRAEEAEANIERLTRERDEAVKQLNSLFDTERALGVAQGLGGGLLIVAERRRQTRQEGWTPAHDDTHINGELAAAAACYLVHGQGTLSPPPLWPWEPSAWKPKDRIANLIRAGALIAAEIDRIHRIAALTPPTKETQA